MFYCIKNSLKPGNRQLASKPGCTAIVIGTYNRAHLMRRSLIHYAAVANDYFPLTLIVLDDGSTDDTKELCKQVAMLEDLDIYYHYLGDKEPGTWRDSAAYLNIGIAAAIHDLKAKYVYVTHPEICIGERTLQESVEFMATEPNCFVLSKGFYLDQDQQTRFQFDQERFDKEKESFLLRQLVYRANDFFGLNSVANFIESEPDFYQRGIDHHPFHPTLIVNYDVFRSWIFGGALAETWLKFKGLTESDLWGAVDVVFDAQRQMYGFPTYTPQSFDAIVVHQNHDDPNQNVVTVRDHSGWEKQWEETFKHYRTLEDKPDFLNLSRWQ